MLTDVLIMKRNFISTRCATLIFSYLILISQIVQADEWVELYNNTRSLGMGGAGVAITSDETALYRNPANLGSLRDVYGTVLDPELEGSSNFVDQVRAGSTSKAFEVSEVMTVLDTNRETYYHARLQVTPSVVLRNFGVGLIYRNQMHAETEVTGATMDTFLQNDFGIVLGGNLRLFDGRLKVGANAKAINRIEVINPVLSTTGPTDMATIASEGTGISYDVGILLQAPWTYLPSLGVVIRDVGNTKFELKDGLRLSATSRPEEVKQTIDIGASLFPIHANNFRSVWTVEYSDVANARNENDATKRIHFGVESNWRDILFLRAGLNQNYWTAGFEIAYERFSWQVASYGEEVGTSVNGTTTKREDRRLNTKFSFRF